VKKDDWIGGSTEPIGKYLDAEDKGFLIGFSATIIDFYIYDSVNDADAVDTYNPSLNTWYHLVGVRGGGRAKLYINSVKEADVDASSVGDIGTVGNLTIGKYTDDTNTFNGIIDEVRIYNYALTETEVLDLYNAYIGGEEDLAYEAAVVIGSGTVAFLFFYLTVTLEKKHMALQSFFLFMGMTFIMLTMSLSRSVAETGGASSQTITLLDTGAVVTTWVFWVTLFYFMVMLLWTALRFMLDYKKKKW